MASILSCLYELGVCATASLQKNIIPGLRRIITVFPNTDSGLAPNKDYKYELVLMDLNGKQYRYPQLNAYSECIKLDLKVNDTDGPDTVKVASNYATLNWITEGALSCSASGDWSGSKGPATGREELGRIARGTSNPGLGKTYNYSMTCNYPKDKTLSDSVSVTVFKYPECDFSADPAVIEVLPASQPLTTGISIKSKQKSGMEHILRNWTII